MAAKEASKKPLCFVIGPIGKDATVERKHSDLLLNAVVKHVLQQDEFGYLVKRADEDADPGMIGDRVVSDIINAELVVSDLTDLNPNAFYELGIRHSTEKPTIHVAKVGTPLPFDNVAHRTIFVDLADWHSIESARTKLAEAVRIIKQPGYRVSNPITQANASFKMRQSEDPRDRLFAEVQERLAFLEKSVASNSPASLARSSAVVRTQMTEEQRRRSNLLSEIAAKAKEMIKEETSKAEMTAIAARLTEEAKQAYDQVSQVRIVNKNIHLDFKDHNSWGMSL